MVRSSVRKYTSPPSFPQVGIQPPLGRLCELSPGFGNESTYTFVRSRLIGPISDPGDHLRRKMTQIGNRPSARYGYGVRSPTVGKDRSITEVRGVFLKNTRWRPSGDLTQRIVLGCRRKRNSSVTPPWMALMYYSIRFIECQAPAGYRRPTRRERRLYSWPTSTVTGSHRTYQAARYCLYLADV